MVRGRKPLSSLLLESDSYIYVTLGISMIQYILFAAPWAIFPSFRAFTESQKVNPQDVTENEHNHRLSRYTTLLNTP